MSDKKTQNSGNAAGNVLKKLVDAVKSGSRELKEFIQDVQGTDAFEREIEDAQLRLKEAKGELTQIMAKQKQANRVVEIISQQLVEHEVLIKDAMQTNDDQQAITLAKKVVELEKDLLAQQVIVETYTKHVSALKQHLEHTERALKDYERQLNIVKTTENIQKATAAIKENYATEDKGFLSAKKAMLSKANRQATAIKEPETSSSMAVNHETTSLSDAQVNEKVQRVLERLKPKSELDD
ncbi:MAG: PspA/IM30 family protein [Marinicella sp.]|nr:PspA/IM30 family protein [Xanthomonadales bacterium]